MRKLFISFMCAWRGFYLIVKEEPNLRIELFVTIVVVGLSLWLRISNLEWCVILLCIGSVLCVEALNSSIERLSDHITQEHHPEIGKIKDIAAGAVLIAALIALLIGLLIFIPKIYRLAV